MEVLNMVHLKGPGEDRLARFKVKGGRITGHDTGYGQGLENGCKLLLKSSRKDNFFRFDADQFIDDTL
jgi:hypothetical protein